MGRTACFRLALRTDWSEAGSFKVEKILCRAREEAARCCQRRTSDGGNVVKS